MVPPLLGEGQAGPCFQSHQALCSPSFQTSATQNQLWLKRSGTSNSQNSPSGWGTHSKNDTFVIKATLMKQRLYKYSNIKRDNNRPRGTFLRCLMLFMTFKRYFVGHKRHPSFWFVHINEGSGDVHIVITSGCLLYRSKQHRPLPRALEKSALRRLCLVNWALCRKASREVCKDTE